MLGFFFSLYASIFWSCIPLLVSEKEQGIAFGLIYSALNVVLIIASLVIGLIHDHTKEFRNGYQFAFIFMIFAIFCALGTTYMMFRLDKKKNGALNSCKSNTEVRAELGKDDYLLDESEYEIMYKKLDNSKM